MDLRIAVFGLLMSAPAFGATGLVWQWPEGAHRRYLVKADVTVPDMMVFNARNNIDTQISALDLAMVIDCSVAYPLGKKGWELRCEIEDAAVRASGTPSTRARVPEVAAEWAQVLRDEASIQIVQGADGRIRSVDLTGVSKQMARWQAIGEVMRQFVARTIAPMDVTLPPKGTDGGVGAWLSTQGSVWALPTNVGSLGSSKTTYTIAAEQGTSVVAAFHGEGTIISGEETSSGGARNTIVGTVDGSFRFDTATGTLVESQYLMEGRATASSVQAEAGRNGMYIQASLVQLLLDGRKPDLGATGERPVTP